MSLASDICSFSDYTVEQEKEGQLKAILFDLTNLVFYPVIVLVQLL